MSGEIIVCDFHVMHLKRHEAQTWARKLSCVEIVLRPRSGIEFLNGDSAAQNTLFMNIHFRDMFEGLEWDIRFQ